MKKTLVLFTDTLRATEGTLPEKFERCKNPCNNPCGCDVEEEKRRREIAALREKSLGFEDEGRMLETIFLGTTEFDDEHGIPQPKNIPQNGYQVDLNVESVWQYRAIDADENDPWKDCQLEPNKYPEEFEYRNLWRFKSEEQPAFDQDYEDKQRQADYEVDQDDPLYADEQPIRRCADCGDNQTLVRPGKYQCDNANCISNSETWQSDDYRRGYKDGWQECHNQSQSITNKKS